MLNLCMIAAMLAGKYVLLLEDIELASLLCMGVVLAHIATPLPWIQLQRLLVGNGDLLCRVLMNSRS